MEKEDRKIKIEENIAIVNFCVINNKYNTVNILTPNMSGVALPGFDIN